MDRRPFLTSTVGSFPQPDELRKARAELKGGKISAGAYRQAVKNFTRAWIDVQRELDIDVLVRGEFERDDMAAFFGEFFGGRRLGFVRSYENRWYRPVEYFRDITHPGGSFLASDFWFMKTAAGLRKVKETITGPATMADWAVIKHGGYYKNRLKFRMDFAGALRTEIEMLMPYGLEILQIDEPALS